MLLNKANFLIANVTSKEPSRYTTNGILVEPDCTVATDGHRMVVIGAVREIPTADFPRVNDVPAPLDTFAPFILPRTAALEIARAIPKKQTIPALECAAVATAPNGVEHSVSTIYTTDLEMHRVFHTRKVTGAYPQWRQVIPKATTARAIVRLSVDLIVSTLSEMQKAGVEQVDLRIFSADSAIRLDGTVKASGQPVMGVLMPLRGDGIGKTEEETLQSWPAPYEFSAQGLSDPPPEPPVPPVPEETPEEEEETPEDEPLPVDEEIEEETEAVA